MGLECGKEVKERGEGERFSKISNNIFFLFLEKPINVTIDIEMGEGILRTKKKKSTQGAQNPYHFPP